MLILNRELLSGALRKKRQTIPFRVLSIAIGVPSATLNRIERCTGKPNVEAFLAVCFWLRREPMDFVAHVDAGEGQADANATL